MKITTGYNSTYKKLAVQWLNEALFFVSSSVLADSLVLLNPLIRQAPKLLVIIAYKKIQANKQYYKLR
jgi:hypothetical protein